jgi:hypothetical protein
LFLSLRLSLERNVFFSAYPPIRLIS